MYAMQCLGGNGYINDKFGYHPGTSESELKTSLFLDYQTGRILHNSRPYTAGAGTQEIRRMLIGREFNQELLGKA